jgi:hypothetical protein
MALGGLGPLDPNAVAATKLRPGGMTAQEVAFKRKAMEDQLGAQKLAADVKDKATQQKEREANMKAFPPITDTVALPYTQEWTKRMAAEQRQLANDLSLWKQGKGSDPNNPLSEAGMARLARNIGHKQYAANTNSYYKLTNDLLIDIDQHPGSYVDGAKEQVLAAQRDVKVAETGEYPDLAGRLFDLQKHVDTELGHLKASGTGQAITLPDGSVKTTSSEYILPEDVKMGVKAALQRPEARTEARRWFANMPKDDQDAVLEFAKNNGMTPDEAMIYNVEMPVYSYTKYRETQSQPSESGLGAKADQRGSLWLGKVLQGYQEGIYGNDVKKADFIFGEGPAKDAIMDNTLVGWKWDVKNVYDKDEKKNVEIVKDIKNFIIDPVKERFVVEIGVAGDGKVTEREVVPFDEAESKLVSRISGLNKENLKGQGIYDISAEVTGEGTRKQAGAGNIVEPRTKPKTGALNLTEEEVGELD